MNTIYEYIYELINKGYGYSEISKFLYKKNICSGRNYGNPLSESGIRYYIKKYNIEPKPIPELFIDAFFFYSDYFNFHKERTFKVVGADELIYKVKGMYENIKRTNVLLNADDYEKNLTDYNDILYKLEHNQEFNVQIKDYLGKYFTQSLLAIKIVNNNNKELLLKHEIFDWMFTNDQYLLFTPNQRISLRGIMRTGDINKNIKLESNIDLEQVSCYFQYIQRTDKNENEFEKMQVCSEESFKTVAVRNGKEYLTKYRIHGFVNIPKLSLSEQDIAYRIRQHNGIKPLTSLDANSFSKIADYLKF